MKTVYRVNRKPDIRRVVAWQTSHLPDLVS